jgi:hypothetical protein
MRVPSNLYSAFAWTTFTLGATQVALVLAGTMWFLIVTLCCSTMFALFLYKVQTPGNRSIKQITVPYLISAGLLITGNALYVHIVFFSSTGSYIIFLSVLNSLFLIPWVIAVLLLQNSSNVSR